MTLMVKIGHVLLLSTRRPFQIRSWLPLEIHRCLNETVDQYVYPEKKTRKNCENWIRTFRTFSLQGSQTTTRQLPYKWYLQFHRRYSKLIHEWTFKRKKQYVFTLQILNNIFSWFMNKLWFLKINIQFKNQGAVKQKSFHILAYYCNWISHLCSFLHDHTFGAQKSRSKRK